MPESPLTLSDSLSSLSSDSSDSDIDIDPKRSATSTSPSLSPSKSALSSSQCAPSTPADAVPDDSSGFAHGDSDPDPVLVSVPPISASVAPHPTAATSSATCKSEQPGTVLTVDAASFTPTVRLPPSALVDADLFGVSIGAGAALGVGVAVQAQPQPVSLPVSFSAFSSPASCSRERDLLVQCASGAQRSLSTSSSIGNASGAQQAPSVGSRSNSVASGVGVGSPLTELFASGLYNGLLSDALHETPALPLQSSDWPAAPGPSLTSPESNTRTQAVSLPPATAEFEVPSNALQRQVNPRARQEADRSLVTHVLRVERSPEPFYDLRITTESRCSNLVFTAPAIYSCDSCDCELLPNCLLRAYSFAVQTSSVTASVPRLSDAEFVELLAHVQRAALEMTRPLSRAEYAAMPRHPRNAVECDTFRNFDISFTVL